MGRLFILVFLLPWWAYVPASLGVLWLAERLYEQGLETEALEAAVLTPGGIPDWSRQIGWAIAAAVALIGVVKRVMSVRARPLRDEEDATDPAEPEMYDPVPGPAEPVFSVPDGVSDDTPLGRLAHGRGALSSLDTEPAPAVFADPPPEPPLAAPAHGAPMFGAPMSDDDPAPAAVPDQPFPPVLDDAPAMAAAADAPRAASDAGFYAKLALAMLVVGGIGYDPSVIPVALPFAAVALFWLGIYVVFRKLRAGTGPRDVADRTPLHQRRPGGGARTAAAGVGGGHIDLTAR